MAQSGRAFATCSVSNADKGLRIEGHTEKFNISKETMANFKRNFKGGHVGLFNIFEVCFNLFE